jgi:His-Xaa-Ser system radical SAM maturase HxsC
VLKLSGHLPILQKSGRQSYLVRLTKNPALPAALKRNRALLTDIEAPEGFRAVLTATASEKVTADINTDIFLLTRDFDYLDEGDIIRLNPKSGSIRCLYRAKSQHNTILLTEQCNHYCLMCSQPPKRIDDSWLLAEAFELIGMIPKSTTNIGYSGGEPTLYGDRFIELLHYTKRSLPHTAVDVLSNGRAFRSYDFARKYAAVQHPNLVIGIPIYSDDPVTHDYVVQARGAFDETVRGILNLKKVRQKVEIRIVIHKKTVDRLVKTCEFIARNLLFVDHVALMGLEITGFTRANLDSLWVDPFEYKDILSDAVSLLNKYEINCSVYNHQLCTVNGDVLPNYRKSISDWKNEYLDECVNCRRIAECGGLFSSAKTYKHSAHIRAFP